ncbi:MAG: HXXEE domain-containing protein [Lachnospiraceae bacterium]|nr:HXXEE domain-containing protein [Lachnospiraceae bacterium]
MRRSLFSKWCDQAWLYVVYLIAVIMAGCLLWTWDAWEISQKLACALAIIVPCHIFEENTLPAGFYYMNNIGFGSKEPMVYPQNRCTNMVTNLGAEIVIVLLTFFGIRTIEASTVTLVFLFGLGETINHTRSGIKMYSRYRGAGKKTIYGPGLITSWCLMIPLSVAGLKWLVEYVPTILQVIGGIGIFLGIAVFLILLPFAFSIRVKSREYAFDDKGYFEKYEKTV